MWGPILTKVDILYLKSPQGHPISKLFITSTTKFWTYNHCKSQASAGTCIIVSRKVTVPVIQHFICICGYSRNLDQCKRLSLLSLLWLRICSTFYPDFRVSIPRTSPMGSVCILAGCLYTCAKFLHPCRIPIFLVPVLWMSK